MPAAPSVSSSPSTNRTTGEIHVTLEASETAWQIAPGRAFAASRPYYGYGPGYAYDDGCYLRRRVVGYNAWGHPIVRRVRVCY